MAGTALLGRIYVGIRRVRDPRFGLEGHADAFALWVAACVAAPLSPDPSPPTSSQAATGAAKRAIAGYPIQKLA